jgi:hypothetical protein
VVAKHPVECQLGQDDVGQASQGEQDGEQRIQEDGDCGGGGGDASGEVGEFSVLPSGVERGEGL